MLTSLLFKLTAWVGDSTAFSAQSSRLSLKSGLDSDLKEWV